MKQKNLLRFLRYSRVGKTLLKLMSVGAIALAAKNYVGVKSAAILFLGFVAIECIRPSQARQIMTYIMLGIALLIAFLALSGGSLNIDGTKLIDEAFRIFG